MVQTPQRGHDLVIAYLAAGGRTLANDRFHYVRKLVDGENAMLEFTTEMEGITVNRVDIIRVDEDGLITGFKAMVRPLKAVNNVCKMLAAQMRRSKD